VDCCFEHECQSLLMATRSPRRHLHPRIGGGGAGMEVIVERVAGLDVHKETVMAAVRVPDEGGVARR
jgi:hypothetical protein